MESVFSPPAAVLRVMNRLRENGHDAALVGGCVRDILLGRPPADWDICTSAYPQVVLALFPTGLDTGAKHGTVTVLLSGDESDPSLHRFSVEVTTWRSESGYSDHRHPDTIRFSTTLEADLSRRDFTINAMAWNPEMGLVDLFQGQKDLAGKLVRCVGDPMQRFREDALRMLRAIRFCSELGFAMDADAISAIRRHQDAISFVSRERTQYEMTRTLTGKCPSCASLWWETGLAARLFSQIGVMPADPGPVLARMERPDPEASIESAMAVSLESAMAVSLESAMAVSMEESKEESADAAVLPWAVFWTACGLAGRIDAVSRWMHENRFPRKRTAGIKKLLQMETNGVPATMRNLRLAALAEGTERLEAYLRLRTITGGITVPDVADIDIPVPDVDGNVLMAAISPEKPPQGREFGAWMECIRMIVCERPECNEAELLGNFARIIHSAFKSNP